MTEIVKTSPFVIHDMVSDHIILAVENCVIQGIRKEKVKRMRHRAVYLDLTNSSSESDQDINTVSNFLDTLSFCAKVRKKPKIFLPPSSSPETVSFIPYSSRHDTDALHSISLNSTNNDNLDLSSWDSNVAIVCHCCSGISSELKCTFTKMPKHVLR